MVKPLDSTYDLRTQLHVQSPVGLLTLAKDLGGSMRRAPMARDAPPPSCGGAPKPLPINPAGYRAGHANGGHDEAMSPRRGDASGISTPRENRNSQYGADARDARRQHHSYSGETGGYPAPRGGLLSCGGPPRVGSAMGRRTGGQNENGRERVPRGRSLDGPRGYTGNGIGGGSSVGGAMTSTTGRKNHMTENIEPTRGSFATGSSRKNATETFNAGSSRRQVAETGRLAQKGTSVPVVADDDCAEYSDRFLTGYEKHQLLGRGACAVVWLASSGNRNGYVAIKQVAKGTTCKKKSDVDAARKEILFADFLFEIPGGIPKVSPKDYPGIAHLAKLLDHVETKRDIWLVMEYGGTCLTKMAYEIKGEFLRGERLYRVNHLPLLQAAKQNDAVLKRLLRQLLSALVVLADHHIVHSDIKPDNILIDEDDRGQPMARFIDFGSSFAFDRPESLALATPEYMPPEALESCASRSMVGGGGGRMSLGRGNGRKPSDPSLKLHHQAQPWSFDIWSLGSILLELSLGAPLWLSYKCRVADDNRAFSAALGLFAVPGRDPEKIRIKQADALRQRGLHRVLRDPAGVVLDDDGIDLLARMLAWNPVDRISPQDALNHPWLT